jgi:hypothetical protein
MRIYFKDGKQLKDGEYTMLLSGNVVSTEQDYLMGITYNVDSVRIHLVESERGLNASDVDLIHRAMHSTRFTVKQEQVVEGFEN